MVNDNIKDGTNMENQESQPNKLNNKYLLIALLVILVVLGAVLLFHSSSTKTTTKPATSTVSNSSSVKNPNSSLSLSPASQNATAGSTLAIEVWADSGTSPVNAVQANLTYPADKLTFVSVDSSKSAFGVTAQETGSNGQVTIARGNIQPLTGKKLVAKVNFTVEGSSGQAAVSFGKGSSLVSSTKNTDILGSLNGGNYSL